MVFTLFFAGGLHIPGEVDHDETLYLRDFDRIVSGAYGLVVGDLYRQRRRQRWNEQEPDRLVAPEFRVVCFSVQQQFSCPTIRGDLLADPDVTGEAHGGPVNPALRRCSGFGEGESDEEQKHETPRVITGQEIPEL